MSTHPSAAPTPPKPFLLRPLNWLLACAPAAAGLSAAEAPPALVFLPAGLAIVPLAMLIVQSTESIAERTGPAVGGLLNATFGNLPELIIAFAALRAGLLEMVRASLIGALLANLLLAMGVAFILGGRKRHGQEYNPAAARTYGSIMLLAALSMSIPAAFNRFLSDAVPRHAQALDTGVCLVLLVLYGLYLVFMLRTHPDFFRTLKAAEESHGPAWSMGRAGAAESGAAIAMARNDRMDLAVGIAMGSSIQIALFVTPVLVLLSHFVAPMPLSLAFTRVEVGALFFAVLIGVIMAGDGRANWFKGAQLVGSYLILAALFYLPPASV